MRDIWDIPTDHRNSTEHFASKPVALYRRILDVAGQPGGLLLDPLSGGGTGAIAAMQVGMRSISIEREGKYTALIKARVAGRCGDGLSMTTVEARSPRRSLDEGLSSSASGMTGSRSV